MFFFSLFSITPTGGASYYSNMNGLLPTGHAPAGYPQNIFQNFHMEFPNHRFLPEEGRSDEYTSVREELYNTERAYLQYLKALIEVGCTVWLCFMLILSAAVFLEKALRWSLIA